MPEVLTAQEAAALLRIGVKRLYEQAQRGAVPGRKVGKEWRFRRDAILAMLAGEPEEASANE